MNKIEVLLTKYGNKLLILALISIIVVSLIYAGLLSRYRFFDHDEFQHVHIAWCMKEGGVLYRSIADHHGPLFALINTALWKTFHLPDACSTLFFFRGLGYFGMLIILLLTYLISKKLFDQKTALTAVVILIINPVFMEKAIEIRPDILMNIFYLTGIYLINKFFLNEENKYYLLIIALLFWALAVWIHFKILLPIVIFLAILAIYNKQKLLLNSIILIFLTFVLLFGFLINTSSIDLIRYADESIVNASCILCPTSFFPILIRGEQKLFRGYSFRVHSVDLRVMQDIILQKSRNTNVVTGSPQINFLLFETHGFLNIAFILLTLLGSIFTFLNTTRKNHFSSIHTILAFALIVSLLVIVPLKCWSQWYMMIIPMCSIFCAYAIISLGGIPRLPKLIIFSFQLGILTILVFSLSTTLQRYQDELMNKNNSEQIRFTNIVLQHTRKNEPIFFFWNNYGGYIFRPHLERLQKLTAINRYAPWYNTIIFYKDWDKDYFSVLDKLLAERKCNYIIAGEYELINSSEFRQLLRNNYYQSQWHKLLWIRRSRINMVDNSLQNEITAYSCK